MAGLNTLKSVRTMPKRRVGRGGARGKTSGRGTKGQNARAGHKKRPEMRDMIKKLPKRRGFGKNRGRTVVGTRLDAVPVSVGRLEALFESKATVSPKTLVQSGAVRARGRTLPVVKLVAGGTLSKALVVEHCGVSASARDAIEKAGGTVAA